MQKKNRHNLRMPTSIFDIQTSLQPPGSGHSPAVFDDGSGSFPEPQEPLPDIDNAFIRKTAALFKQSTKTSKTTPVWYRHEFAKAHDPFSLKSQMLFLEEHIDIIIRSTKDGCCFAFLTQLANGKQQWQTMPVRPLLCGNNSIIIKTRQQIVELLHAATQMRYHATREVTYE